MKVKTPSLLALMVSTCQGLVAPAKGCFDRTSGVAFVAKEIPLSAGMVQSRIWEVSSDQLFGLDTFQSPAKWAKHFHKEDANAIEKTDLTYEAAPLDAVDVRVPELPFGGEGLVTSTTKAGSLANRFGIEHPLDRMALAAGGNLQRLVSSYYDAPVEVVVEYCRSIMGDSKLNTRPNKWDRLVHLKVHNQTFCKARSTITVHDPFCQRFVESGQVGLGQLFRYLGILPEFELHKAGPYPVEAGGGFWRKYTLRSSELSCFIHEDFSEGLWNLHPI